MTTIHNTIGLSGTEVLKCSSPEEAARLMNAMIQWRIVMLGLKMQKYLS